MIEQRVNLSREAHERIGKAQHDLGLARFEDALGYFIEGVFVGMSKATILTRMDRGRAMILARSTKRASRGRA